ncbi:MAG TPA: hypothetical protein VK658_01190 [Chryseolinea sp.]|nr:hypothetical protein [Chryseolinea sp.]
MQNPFDPSTGTEVTKSEAMAWIEKYDREMRKDKDADTKSIFFGKAVLEKMLEGRSAGITFFLGLKYNEDVKKEVVNLVLVPTTSDGTLLWASSSATALNDGESGAADFGTPCPPYCPK